MSYSILRVAKVKGSTNTKGIQKHNQRENKNYNNKDINHEKSYKNYDLINNKNIDYKQMIDEKIDANYTGHRKIRSDAIRHVDGLITSDKEFFNGLSDEETNQFFKDSLEFLEQEYGKENVLYATVHLDEHVPHMHFGFVPLTDDGRLSAKERLGNKKALTELQDRFNQHVNQKGYKLGRGTAKEVSEREHRDIDRFKKDTQYHKQELQKVQHDLKQLSTQLSTDIERMKSVNEFDYEDEKAKKGLFAGREEYVTGRKIVSAEEFEKLQETISTAERIVGDYESIKNTDLYLQNKLLKEKNLQLAKGHARLRENNIDLSSELDKEKEKREKAETFSKGYDEIVKGLYKSLREHVRGFEKLYDTVKDKFLQGAITNGSGRFMEIIQNKVHLEDKQEQKMHKTRSRDDLEL